MEAAKLMKPPFAAVVFLACFLQLKAVLFCFLFLILWLGIQV